MNKNQKILTIVALAVFGATILLHFMGYPPWARWPAFQAPSYETYDVVGTPSSWHREWRTAQNNNIINDVRMPVFVLAVFYAGLFFILASKRPPRD